MTRIGLLVLSVLLLVSSASAAGPGGPGQQQTDGIAHAITFTDQDWAANDPFVPLNADGTGLWAIYSGVRLGYVPARDDATAVLRAARLRNPWLLESLLEHAMTQWIESGAAERKQHPNAQGTAIVIRDQAHFDWLQASWRAVVKQELGPYLAKVKPMLAPEQIVALALDTDVEAVSFEDLPTFEASWYSRRDDVDDVARRFNASVYCVPCEANQPTAFVCLGQLFSCAAECILSAFDCQAVVVQPIW